MTDEQVHSFRLRFKNIMYLKAQLHRANSYIGAFTHYDRNGSHEDAIMASLIKKDKIKAEYYEALAGKTYEQWKKKGTRITLLRHRIKTVKRTREKWIKELEKMEYDATTY